MENAQTVVLNNQVSMRSGGHQLEMNRTWWPMRMKQNRSVAVAYHWLDSIIDPLRLLSLPRYLCFIRDWLKYSAMEGSESIHLLDTYPCLRNGTKTSRFDRHYFYQDIWAFRRIFESKVSFHVDVGSRVDFVGMLSAVTNVAFVDLRPLEVQLERFRSIKGSILDLPFADDSVPSLSCLHVAEHIGLGRYGDPLDPLGTVKAAKELSRVLARQGSLYFSLPVGKPRLCFNAHRVHSPRQICEYFAGLQLVGFSGIDDQRVFRQNIEIASVEDCDYACGLFWFRKPEIEPNES